MPADSNVARARAEAIFNLRKEQENGRQEAWAEYKAKQEALSARTRELRELRLARAARPGAFARGRDPLG